MHVPVTYVLNSYVYFPSSPLPYVSVSPLAYDFTVWHGNLKGPEGTPYEGGVFHFTIEFKSDHPRCVVHTYSSFTQQTLKTLQIDWTQIFDAKTDG